MMIIHHSFEKRWQVRWMRTLALCFTLLILLASLLIATTRPVGAASATDGPRPHTIMKAHRPQLPASSPSCSGERCNFTNPYATDCAGQSWDVWWVVLSGYLRDSHGNIGGYVQLWWSATCQTNWTRVVSYHRPYELEALIRLQNGYGNTANASLSEQFYAPSTLACSSGAIWLGSGSPTYSGEVSQYQGGC
jgi:hypothetical protein